MEPSNDQAEDLSESNNSCTSTSTSASEPSFIDPYKSEYNATRTDGPADLSVAQSNKDYQRNDVYNESSSPEDPSSSLFRSVSKDSVQKEAAMYTFCREIRQKSLHAVLERSAAVAAASSAGAKDLEFMKAYGLPGVDQVKDLSFSTRIVGVGLERLRASSMHADSSASTVDPDDLKTLQQQPPPQRSHHLDHPMAFERLRHPIFQSGDQFAHPQHHLTHHHHAITQIQHGGGNQHQPHQHPQAKSFTIDAILGLRGGAQRDKQRHHPYRKNQGQENTGKSLSTSSGSNNGMNASSPTGSKLKRVRTIFTNEQLERLENEFARQQYMVGPERLYLAHALRLTEAQVKVWFQNRRIKWRKINHEKQSQRLHELHHHPGPVERGDDSNETVEW